MGEYNRIGNCFPSLLDVVYSLIYRQYHLFQPFQYYLYSVLFVGATLQCIYHLNRLLDSKFNWNDNPAKRFLIQWGVNFGTGLVVLEAIRWSVVLLFYRISYVRLSDEVVILVFILVVTTGISMSDLAVFLMEKWRFSLAELERFKRKMPSSGSNRCEPR